MKVLLLSITAGYGHNVCAKAIIEYLESQKVECRMLNAYEYVNPLLSETIARGYLIATKYSKEIYKNAYRLAEKRTDNPPAISFYRITHNLLSKKLISYINDYAPDAIVCTHIFAAQMASELKRKKLFSAKTFGVVTDFTMHPYWEDSKLDYYVIPNELLINQCTKKDIPQGKILSTGIPINPDFSETMSKLDARELLQIEDKPTILLMAGGMGYGDLSKTIDSLDTLSLDFQMIAVCGNNKRLKKALDKKTTTKTLKIYGFINNVDIMMDAADCICTKPGGLTTSEALAKKLPIIITDAIPGQEERNMDFLLNNGLGMRVTKTFPIDECIYQLFNNPKRLNDKTVYDKVAKPFSSRNLGDFIIRVCEE